MTSLVQKKMFRLLMSGLGQRRWPGSRTRFHAFAALPIGVWLPASRLRPEGQKAEIKPRRRAACMRFKRFAPPETFRRPREPLFRDFERPGGGLLVFWPEVE